MFVVLNAGRIRLQKCPKFTSPHCHYGTDNGLSRKIQAATDLKFTSTQEQIFLNKKVNTKVNNFIVHLLLFSLNKLNFAKRRLTIHPASFQFIRKAWLISQSRSSQSPLQSNIHRTVSVTHVIWQWEYNLLYKLKEAWLYIVIILLSVVLWFVNWKKTICISSVFDDAQSAN